MFPFQFANPFWLLVFPVLLCFFLFIKKQGSSAFVRFVHVATRCLLCAVLVLALSGFSVVQTTENNTTVFLFDLSDSVRQLPNQLQFAQEATKTRTKNDYFGSVAFGENAVIEAMPNANTTFSSLDSFVLGEHTNLSEGLLLARSIMTAPSQKRIVLLSDGLENVDLALNAARILKEEGIVVDGVALSQNLQDEVQITSLHVPKILNKHVVYDIEVDIFSLSSNTAKLLLYKNNGLFETHQIDLAKGSNRFVFQDKSETGGGIAYRAEIFPQNDTYSQNNRIYAYSTVQDVPHILLIDNNKSTNEMAKILENSFVQIKIVPAFSAPDSLDLLLPYDAIVLADCSADDLPIGFLPALESYAKNIGGGVLVTGGENSFALGGYSKTPLETLLPVDMQLKKKEDAPNMAMLVLLDRSGSMSGQEFGVSKMDVAKEAVIRSVDALTSNDQFGVIAFDDQATWAVPFAMVNDQQAAIKNNIAHISEGGGTSILPSLAEAVSILEGTDAKLKHIILLTDGQAEQSGYEPLLKKMNNASITLSSIAVGKDSDKKLLNQLATRGNGRYYYVDEFTNLPKLFTKETLMASKAYLNNRVFFPVLSGISPILSGVSALPTFGGYVSTTAKDRGDVLLKSDTDEPVLATWQFGLGRTAAWTTDVSGGWTASAFLNEEVELLFRNTISWLIKKQEFLNANLTVLPKGKTHELTLTTPYSEGVQKVSGTFIATDNQETPLEFSNLSPGVFSANVKVEANDIYVANLTLEKPTSTTHITMGVPIPYSVEYDVRNQNGSSLLEKIVSTTGGRMLTDPSTVLAPLNKKVLALKNMQTPLLVLAMLLFLMDVLLRRFPFVLLKCEAMFLSGVRKFFSKKAKPVSFAPTNQLNLQSETKQNLQKQDLTKEEKVKNTSDILLNQKRKRNQ